MKKTIDSGQERISFKINILNSQGRNIPISVSTSVLLDDNDTIIGGVETFRDLTTVEMLRKEIRSRYTFEDIISKNHEIRSILGIIPAIAASGSTVLIEGPSGSGKELFAKAIHNLSGKKGRFVAVNCAALPETLLESELFGYVKGAFTEAKKDKPGRFALAESGTIFLDEIGDAKTSPILIEHFIEKFNAMKGKDIEGASQKVLDILMRLNFPGDVRELENIIEYAFVLCRGRMIEVRHLPQELQTDRLTTARETPEEVDSPLDQAEATAIRSALGEHGGNRKKTAAHLGINKTTLWRKMKKYGITYTQKT